MILSTKGDYVFYNRPERIGKNYKDYMKDPNTQKIFKDEIISKDRGLCRKSFCGNAKICKSRGFNERYRVKL